MPDFTPASSSPIDGIRARVEKIRWEKERLETEEGFIQSLDAVKQKMWAECGGAKKEVEILEEELAVSVP